LDSSNPSKKAIIGIVVVVLLVIAATAVVVQSGNNKSDSANVSTDAQSTSETVSSSPSVAPASTTNFKDGTYTATARYNSPGGVQSITVKLTIAGNIVTDSSLQQTATEREDEQYQGAFESEYKSNVVGKKISELSLSRVAGASLTNDGFNSALADIENQAKA
jgi:hypothetical protein